MLEFHRMSDEDDDDDDDDGGMCFLIMILLLLLLTRKTGMPFLCLFLTIHAIPSPLLSHSTQYTISFHLVFHSDSKVNSSLPPAAQKTKAYLWIAVQRSCFASARRGMNG